ncbi:winged helix-turn-helix domain-containing protein [Agrococcus sp. HG114]|uniref:winged helix-turn-helix domain-containing protein n=1 Tax=Agrococcus sp. HG114 TaxID=2969757 RepID=UPI00215A3842|nr:winged helix-turn-helix domain-containing protein [Agrococcus sp. HG114]MCR8670294.1 winged helix-turn-helix domain-containing protein [Agrococcus sp. HG114]
MHVRSLPATTLVEMRFGSSQLHEAVASLRALQGAGDGRHARWAAWARPRLRDVDLSRLLALVPPRGHLADALMPAAAVGRPLAEATALVAATGAAALEADVRLLADQGSEHEAVLAAAARSPEDFARAVAEDLERYWAATLAPLEQRLERLVRADLEWRTRRFAEGGPAAVLGSLHERLRLTADGAALSTICRAPAPSERGLLLVPTVFAWPDLLVRDVAGEPLTLCYGPRGVRAAWLPDPAAPSSLGPLLGETRAGLLAALSLPSTTASLARAAGIAPSTASEHLRTLADAGLVTRSRRGRLVLYARSARADDWLASLGG